jgi:hypothetical protein
MSVRHLFSVGALAGELGCDRTVLAVALSEIPPDGQRSGRPVYRVATALTAMGLRERRDRRALPKPKRPAPRGTDPLVGVFLDRVAQRGTHPDLSAPLLTVPEAAEIHGVPESSVLTWLQAGAPVAQAGDRVTGEGVLLDGIALLDWVALLAARTGNDIAARRRLALDGWPA